MNDKRPEHQNPAVSIIDHILEWVPRIVTFLVIVFLSLFSFDVFSEANGLWKTMTSFLIHNIPVFILTAILIVSWRRPWMGALGFIIIGVLYVILLPARNKQQTILGF